MREILFRGKRCDNSEWVQGYYIRAEHHWHNHGIHKDWITLGASANGGWFALHNKYAVKSETVGQFTGLTDKNGKKIFEGDIVRCISMTDMANMVVIFEDGEFRMVLCEKYKDYIPGCGFYAIRCFDKEVIGNIHDNPELLENP